MAYTTCANFDGAVTVVPLDQSSRSQATCSRPGDAPWDVRDLSANLWCAGGTPQSVEIIAKNDVRPLCIPTTSLDLALQTVRTYAQLRHEAGHGSEVHTKLALWTYVAGTEAEARRGAERYMCEYSDSALRHYEMLGTHFAGLKGYEAYAASSEAMRENPDAFLRGFFDSHPWGTPEQTIARATELAHAFGTNEIMFVFKYGSMPIEDAHRSMKLFADEVMPALQALEPRPLEVVSV